MSDLLKQNLEKFRNSVIKIGGEFDKIEIAPPATQSEIEGVENQLGFQLPDSIREFSLEVTSAIEFHWNLPEKFVLPASLNEIFSGGFSYSLFAIPEQENNRASWQNECFPDPNDSYDVVWHNKIGLVHVPNGDCISSNFEGHIIYLSHDDGAGHGIKMADSLTELLIQWTPLGCPGPEDWQWLPFAVDTGINGDTELAKLWLSTIE